MNRQFGALSGIAMCLIVLNHSIHLGLEIMSAAGFAGPSTGLDMILNILQAFGAFAVPTFLFISGCFIAYAAQGDVPKLSSKFLIGSIRHILIPYVIWSVVFYFEIFFHRDASFTFSGYVKNLLVGDPFHFIPLLIFYYVISPILIIAARRYPVFLIAALGIYQLFLLDLLQHAVTGFHYPDFAQYLTPPIIRQTFADWGIYFPIGLVYGLYSKTLQPISKKIVLISGFVTIITFILGLLNACNTINFPISRHLTPLAFILTIPAITRDRIPAVRTIERIGKRSYGLYLTHLIVLDIMIWLISEFVPGLISISIVIFPLLFLTGLTLPIILMEWTAASPLRKYYRYIFG